MWAQRAPFPAIGNARAAVGSAVATTSSLTSYRLHITSAALEGTVRLSSSLIGTVYTASAASAAAIGPASENH